MPVIKHCTAIRFRNSFCPQYHHCMKHPVENGSVRPCWFVGGTDAHSSAWGHTRGCSSGFRARCALSVSTFLLQVIFLSPATAQHTNVRFGPTSALSDVCVGIFFKHVRAPGPWFPLCRERVLATWRPTLRQVRMNAARVTG